MYANADGAASGGYYDTFDPNRNVATGGWWAAGGLVLAYAAGGSAQLQIDPTLRQQRRQL